MLFSKRLINLKGLFQQSARVARKRPITLSSFNAPTFHFSSGKAEKM